MLSFITFLFQENVVEEKLQNAPDNSYAIGVLIGYLLPLIVLAAFAYLLYSFMKNRNKN